MSDCGIAIAKIFTDWSGSIGALSSLGINAMFVIRLLLMCGILAVSHNMIKSEVAKDTKLSGGTLAARFLTYGLMIAAIAVAWVSIYVIGNGSSAFIYFQF